MMNMYEWDFPLGTIWEIWVLIWISFMDNHPTPPPGWVSPLNCTTFKFCCTDTKFNDWEILHFYDAASQIWMRKNFLGSIQLWSVVILLVSRGFQVSGSWTHKFTPNLALTREGGAIWARGIIFFFFFWISKLSCRFLSHCFFKL